MLVGQPDLSGEAPPHQFVTLYAVDIKIAGTILGGLLLGVVPKSVLIWEGDPVLRLSIFVGENDRWHHRPLYHEIVHRARRAGLAGATVLRDIEGYGANSRIHTAGVFRLSSDLPLLIVIIDTEERVRGFLPQLDDLDISGLVVLDRAETFRPSARPDRR